MKTPFRFPLLAGDISSFCHPSPMHVFHESHILDGALHGANGYIAVRADRGAWMPSDFPPASEAFAARLSALPWGTFPPDTSAEWREMDDIRPHLFRYAAHGVWRKNHTLAPCPVWRTGGHHLIRLSHLQHLSRLPRCRIYAGPQCQGSPAYFTFNGGRALVPVDRRLNIATWEVFQPQTDVLDGTRIPRSNTPTLSHGGHLKGWPPIDQTPD